MKQNQREKSKKDDYSQKYQSKDKEKEKVRRRVYSSYSANQNLNANEKLPEIQKQSYEKIILNDKNSSQYSKSYRSSNRESVEDYKQFYNTTSIQNIQSAIQLKKVNNSTQNLQVQTHTPFISRPSSNSSTSKIATFNTQTVIQQNQSNRDDDQISNPEQKERLNTASKNQQGETRVIQEESESELMDTLNNISMNSQMNEEQQQKLQKSQIKTQKNIRSQTEGNKEQNKVKFDVASNLIDSHQIQNNNNNSELEEKIGLVKQKVQKLASEKFKQEYNSKFFEDLRTYSAINWQEISSGLLQEKQYTKASHINIERLKMTMKLFENFIVEELNFIEKREDIRLINSILLQNSAKLIEDQSQIIKKLVDQIPEVSFLNEQSTIIELFNLAVRMHNPAELTIKRKELQDLYIKTYDSKFKSLGTSPSKMTKQYLATIQETISSLRLYEEYELQLTHKVRVYDSEIKQMKLIITEYEQKANTDYEKLQQNSPFKVQTKENILGELDKTLETMYVENIRELNQKIEENEEQKDKLLLKLKEKEKQTKLQKEELEKLQQKPLTEEKSTQINLILMPNKPIIKKNPFSIYTNDYVSPFTFSKNCTSSIISMAFSDKVLIDYLTFQKRKPIKNIVTYISEWFLKQFGSKVVAQIFQKNFIQTIEELQYSNKRFQLFGQFCGMDDTLRTNKKKSNHYQEIKIQFYASNLAVMIYLKVCFAYRFKLIDNSVPLLPLFSGYSLNEEEGGIQQIITGSVHDHLQMPIKKAYQVIETMLIEQLKIINNSTGTQEQQQQQIQDLQKSFENFAKEDLRNRKKLGNATFQREIQAIKTVSLDVIASFILEYVGESYANNLDRLLIQLKIVQGERRNGNFSLEEFTNIFQQCYPDKNKEYIEDCFGKFFMFNTSIAVTTTNNEEQRKLALKSFIEHIFQEDSYTLQFYLQHQLQHQYQQQHKARSPQKKQKITQSTTEGPLLEIPATYVKEITYDVYASYLVLDECYENVKNLIRSEEGKDERIKLENENLKLLLGKIPKDSLQMEEQRVEGIEICENSWKTFRKLLDYTNSKLQ